MTLDAFDRVRLHGAHVVSHIADTHGLEERN
jgi:hypothetical protein